MKNIAIIGGGAAGLVAAIFAAREKNNVTIFEKRNICGKKILVTGNGRCNYWNKDDSISHYNTTDMDTLKKIYTEENKKDALELFNKLGIVPYIKNGYYYPYSKEATTIKNALLEEAKRLNIEIRTDFKVESITKKNGVFLINGEEESIEKDKVILATGSFAYYNDPESSIGYSIAKSFGHNIIKLLPALVQLKGNENFFKDWKGIRSDVKVALYDGEEQMKEEEGEILLTDYGVSGICIFNLSSIAARILDKKEFVNIRINFVPWLQEESLVSWLDERIEEIANMKIDGFLEGFLNSKLVSVILNISKISKDKYWKDLTNNEKELLANNIQNFNLKITGTKSFREAQVSSGGVDLNEINPLTMESKKEKGLHLAGEILDVDGDCGGYNLSFAFISGMLAGKSVGNSD